MGRLTAWAERWPERGVCTDSQWMTNSLDKCTCEKWKNRGPEHLGKRPGGGPSEQVWHVTIFLNVPKSRRRHQVDTAVFRGCPCLHAHLVFAELMQKMAMRAGVGGRWRLSNMGSLSQGPAAWRLCWWPNLQCGSHLSPQRGVIPRRRSQPPGRWWTPFHSSVFSLSEHTLPEGGHASAFPTHCSASVDALGQQNVFFPAVYPTIHPERTLLFFSAKMLQWAPTHRIHWFDFVWFGFHIQDLLAF